MRTHLQVSGVVIAVLLSLSACDDPALTPTGPVDGPVFSITSPSPVTLTPLGTPLNSAIGIDHHDPTNQVVMSVNYASGTPHNFELVAADGSRTPFSSISGFTDEVKIATAKDDGGGISVGGFTPGDLFTGNGVAGQIARIDADGLGFESPWVALPGEPGLMRGSLYVDRTGVWGGDLIVVTTSGGVWRISSSKTAAKVAQIPAHLEGLITLPADPRYGPWAGKIVIGAEGIPGFYAVDTGGTVSLHQFGDGVHGLIQPEDIDLIPAGENFFGVDYGGGKLWGAGPAEFADKVGDILVAQESGQLWHVRWDVGTSAFKADVVAEVTQWEHVTFSTAGIVEIPPSNEPPLADAGADQNVEWTTAGAGATTLDGSGSTDPDGDDANLTYSWAEGGTEIATGVGPTVNLSLGVHTIVLTVTDPAGDSDEDEVVITVEDTTAPVVTAALVPVPGKSLKSKKGLFTVEFSCSDECDTDPTVTAATLNGVPVTNGQVVELRLKSKKSDASMKSEKSTKSEKSGKSTKSEKPVRFDAPAFVLLVECVDEAGNVGSATAEAEFAEKSAKSAKSKKSKKG